MPRLFNNDFSIWLLTNKSPSSVKLIKPLSKSLSAFGQSKRPLQPSKRSSLVAHSDHAFMWLVIRKRMSSTPVRRHAFSICLRLDLNLPWPLLDFTSASFSVWSMVVSFPIVCSMSSYSFWRAYPPHFNQLLASFYKMKVWVLGYNFHH